MNGVSCVAVNVVLRNPFVAAIGPIVWRTFVAWVVLRSARVSSISRSSICRSTSSPHPHLYKKHAPYAKVYISDTPTPPTLYRVFPPRPSSSPLPQGFGTVSGKRPARFAIDGDCGSDTSSMGATDGEMSDLSPERAVRKGRTSLDAGMGKRKRGGEDAGVTPEVRRCALGARRLAVFILPVSLAV